MESAIKILHLEDNELDAQLVQSTLKRADVRFEYFLADNEKDFLSYLENQDIDIILSDYALPDYSGKEALLVAKSRYSQIPFIFVSGTMGEDAAIESLLNGATDYVLKNKMERLVQAVYRAFNEAEEQKARMRAEKELRKLSSAVEQSPNSIIITDTKGNIEYINPATIKLSGYSNEELIGKNPRIFSSGENREEAVSLLWKTITAGKVWQGEFHNKKRNGELYWEAASISPIIDNHNVTTHYLAIKEDITEHKILTSNLIAAKEKAEESDRLKTAFLNNISHEIRTPMNAIIGFSEFLSDPDLQPEKRKEFADIIVQNCNQLLSIISDIISIATLEAGQEIISEKELDLNTILKNLFEQFQINAKRQHINLNLKPFLPPEENMVISDETKLVKVLTNLIGNALKFTKQGHVNFGYDVKDKEIEFSVEDTGIGIPPEMQEEIFDRFRQVETTSARQFGGSGLGLSISKAYVELLGGKMWVVSKLNNGSTFYFTIPYKKADKKTLPEKKSGDGITTAIPEPKTILVAEDEDSNFMLMQILLSGLNVNILRVVNGEEAVEICRLNKHINLVLMDIKMPVMDGYDATRKIREFLPQLPIIAQTAFTSDIDRLKALACGCNDFISKPFKKELLIAKIIEQLNKT